MKFLAMLRDSLREAIDTKVFYVTVACSFLLILVVSSVSFRSVTVEDEVRQLTSQFNFFINLASGGQVPARFDISDFQQTNDAPEPWNGDYRFAFLIRTPTAEEAEQFRKGKQLSAKQLQEAMEQRFYWLDNIQVTEAKAADPTEVRYEVTTRGTKITSARSWRYEPSVLFAIPLPFLRSSLGGAVYWIEDTLVNGVGAWAGVLAGVVITAFFIPNMLRKGTIDLLLVKPVHRPTLLLYKYVGGLSFVFLNTVVAVVGMWLALGLRSGIWAPGFLASILTITFFFAILYAVSTLIGVLTRSPIVSIMITIVVWFFLFLVGTFYKGLAEVRTEEEMSGGVPHWVYTTVDTLHDVLPRTKDLDILMSRVMSHEVLTEAEVKQKRLDKLPDLHWAESLTVSAVFIALMLGLACWRFTVKDY